MPELDGFELAAMIRQHPRCQQTAIIFVSAVHLTDLDRRARATRPARSTTCRCRSCRRSCARRSACSSTSTARRASSSGSTTTLEERVAARTAELEATIAQLREREHRLRLQGEALAEADRRKNEFLAMLAHELRNPLQPIRTAVELLRQTEGDARAARVVRATSSTARSTSSCGWSTTCSTRAASAAASSSCAREPRRPACRSSPARSSRAGRSPSASASGST